MRPELSPGRSSPLGPRWDGTGTDFAVHSPDAALVELCLFDGDGREHRVPLSRTGPVWHGRAAGVGPGQRYGFRAHGRYDPGHGLWFDPGKLLTDPYARGLSGGLHLDEAVLSRTVGRDSAPFVPRSVVVDERFDWQGDAAPGTPWARTVVYELPVRSFTAGHPGMPKGLRGTYAGLAHPASLEHLLGLGVTAVELLPVHAFVSEPHLLRLGLANRWGYNTLGFFAPHAGYAADRSGPVAEFKAMVRTLHAAGLEVLLDVVYNHGAEGDEHGPTLSLRGLDNAGSFRLAAHGSRYDDVTGTGSTLDLRSPHVLRMVADSLRYWVQEMHVDGFRFDLAPALLRGDAAVQDRAALLTVIGQDPVLREVKLVAEPWDIGPGGYRLGAFPPPWAEWNDRFRDTVRDAWRGHTHGVRPLASALAGSPEVFAGDGRRARAPWASLNLVTAHDGFTLHDLTAYEHKRNGANGEDNRDGSDHDRSWNCGVEGPTDDAPVLALRRRQARNMLATLLLSVGTPMLTMGDELGRTQRGNNNAYCQDELAWQPWDPDAQALALLAFTRALVALRREHPVLRSSTWWTGQPDAKGRRDVTWFGADGRELRDGQWDQGDRRTLLALLDGSVGSGEAMGDVAGVPTGATSAISTSQGGVVLAGEANVAGRSAPSDNGPGADPDTPDRLDDPGSRESFLLVLHLGGEPMDIVLPEPPVAGSWQLVLDTADERGTIDGALPVGPGSRRVEGRSLLLLRSPG